MYCVEYNKIQLCSIFVLQTKVLNLMFHCYNSSACAEEGLLLHCTGRLMTIRIRAVSSRL